MSKHDEFTQEQLQKLGQRIKSLRIEKGYTNYEHFVYEHNIPRAQFGGTNEVKIYGLAACSK